MCELTLIDWLDLPHAVTNFPCRLAFWDDVTQHMESVSRTHELVNPCAHVLQYCTALQVVPYSTVTRALSGLDRRRHESLVQRVFNTRCCS